MGKVVDALVDGTPLGKLVWDAVGVDAWWEIGVGKYIREALIPVPDTSFNNDALGQQQMVRSPIEARRSIYGRAMVSGPMTFVNETGNDNEYLHFILPLAAHRCASVEEIYFNDELVYSNGQLDDKYKNHARINIHLGDQTTADPNLVAECSNWTVNHVGFGITYLAVRLKHDPKFFTEGLPNVKALVKGKPIYDPRLDSSIGGAGSHRINDVTTWAWSDNWALCVLDYTLFESGVGALPSEVDFTTYALAANDSDQLIVYDDEGHTEKRYTCNGTFTQSMTPASVLDKLLTAGAGMQSYLSGKYQLYSGVYQGPYVLELGEDDLAGNVEIRPFNARANLCNAVRGTFIDPENFYQPTDFPPYESSYYRAQDGDEYIDHDVDLAFTQSLYTAQRLAKLYLELNRAAQQIVLPLNMIGLSLSVGKVVAVNLPRLGINGEYQVVDWDFDFGQPCKVTLRETAIPLFEYDLGSYTTRPLTPPLNLPNAKNVPTVTGLVWIALGDDANYQGTLTWNAPGGNSAYRYQIEVTDTAQTLVYQTSVEGTLHNIPKLDAGTYTISIWAVNLFSNRSNIPATLVIGANAPPTITSIQVDAGALELVLRPQTAALIAQTTVFEVVGGSSNLFINALPIGQGKEVIWPSLHANTVYYVWARAINNFGAGSWFGPVAVQTTADKSALVELLGDTFKSFTWFAWADDASGSGFTTVEALGDGKAYMGIATDKPTASPSGNWQDYTWSKIQTEIPPVFTPEEEAKLDNLMAGKLPFAPDKDMLAAQDALSNPALANNLITALSLLNQGINAPALGGETPSGAQSKASSAQSAAIAAAATDATTKANNAKAAAESYALAKANLAETTAKAYADGIVSDEEARAIADAQAKADAAKAAAIATATADPTLRNDAYYRTLPDFFFERGLLCYSTGYEGLSENLFSLSYDPAFSVVKDGEHGGNILRVSGERWIYGIGLIPIDTSKRYKMRIKVRQFSNGTGRREVYAGVATLDKNLNFISSEPGTHRYCCAIGVNISESDGWHVFEGYITGAGNDSFNQFRVGTAYIRPMLIVNYTNGNGIADIDELSFYEVTDKGDLIAIGMETSAEAQAKADAAKNAAIVAAAADASAKANTAKAQAEANAALDALNKQNYAISTAKSYTDNNRDGANLVKNSAFLMETAGNINSFTNIPGWNGWTFNIDTYQIDVWRSGDWALKGGATAFLHQVSAGTGSSNKDLTLHTEQIPVAGGKNYCFSAYVGVHRCSAALFGVFYDINDANLGSTSFSLVNYSEGFSGGTILNNYKRLKSFGVAPSNAAYMRLFVRKYDTDSGFDDSYLFFTRVSACAVSADTIIAPDWSPGLEYTPDVQNDNAIKTISLGNFNADVGLINTLLASSGLFDTLKARLGNFGGLTADAIASFAIATNHLQAGAVTADKLIADTALIQKLISNIGLFNQLQAQIAAFGGLAANSIAAKAITVDKLDVLSRSLVNNFSVTGSSIGWSGGFPLVDFQHKGQWIKAMVCRTSGNVQVTSDYFEIDHSKVYEVNFTIYRNDGGQNGQRYFGMYADGEGIVDHYLADNKTYAGSDNNFYFWSGVIDNNIYMQMRSYIVGSEVDISSIPECLNVVGFCRLRPGTKNVCLRVLNYYNAGVETEDVWLNPSVTELGGGQISANQIIANSALFDKFKARIGSFGGLTATEIQADTALINKLVGTSGLFNDLVARLAVFGGLTANSIASDAILGRHIKAGETIEGPVIVGGQFRLIGPNTMKIESETPFGPDSLVEWRGPKLLVGGVPDWANIRKSNASSWTDAAGNEYFGGALSAGVLKTGVTNPDKNPYAASSYPVTIGPFGSNGKAKNVVVSFALSAVSQSSSNPSSPTQPQLSWQLQRKIDSGSWVTVSSGVFNGVVTSSFESEYPSHWDIDENCNGSFTFTDNTLSTSDFYYRVLVVSYTRFHITSNVIGQTLTLVSTEQ